MNMAPKTILSNEDLGKKIKVRRNELRLTIEEAASRAGVGVKTWCRYESGGSIRKDKCKGICKALNWRSFPDNAGSEPGKNLIEEYKGHEAWSQFLADNYGVKAAVSFAVGSDVLLDYIEQDLSDLASMPVGSHIGQLNTSFIKMDLPAQFLMRYTYDFLYQMKCTLVHLRRSLSTGRMVKAHTVMEELIIYLCNEEAMVFMEVSDERVATDSKNLGYSEDWVFDMFDDEDIITFLYSNSNLEEDHPYFFTHWNEQQFYMDNE